ncbi:hypothetical protein ACJVDH_04215 [Pedobacter sp. AW1-32]|uniref:hypothetical protein n=1 Tax=Pedobacter sp. AW1-32 TaxID=3383026 RepID=UPI003FEDD9B4
MCKKPILFLCIALIAASCTPNPGNNKSAEKPAYFNVKAYFDQQSRALNKRKVSVVKIVSVNGSTEKKELVVQDWTKELSAFSNNDINKTAWQGEFSVTKTDSTIVYRTKNIKIPVRELLVHVNNDTVDRIQLIIQNKNLLYTSTDTLSYTSGKFYRIKKQQNIWLLKPREYVISAEIK